MAPQKSTQKTHQTSEDNHQGHTQGQIQTLAYQLWLERGAPIGSPEKDWLEAEARLNHPRGESAKAARQA